MLCPYKDWEKRRRARRQGRGRRDKCRNGGNVPGGKRRTGTTCCAPTKDWEKRCRASRRKSPGPPQTGGKPGATSEVRPRGDDVAYPPEGRRAGSGNSAGHRLRTGRGLRKKPCEGCAPGVLFFWKCRWRGCRSWDKGKTYRRWTWPIPPGLAGGKHSTPKAPIEKPSECLDVESRKAGEER
jgi:hypothetical protein